MSAKTSQTIWNADRYVREAAYVTELGANVFNLLNPQPGEHILDLGCGDGRLSQQIKESGASVVGVDASDSMVATARDRGIDARLMNGHSLAFDSEFDAVFSNAALHWMPRAEDVAAGVAKALKPGGRFVGEFGGFGNVAAIVSTIIAVLRSHGFPAEDFNPWYNPRVAEYTEVLEKAGFAVKDMTLIYRPTHLPQGMEAWLTMFAADFFDPLGDRRDALKSEVVEALRTMLQDQQGEWYADHVRLRFVALKG